MGKSVSVIGIILVMIGTIFSLWSILTTKEKYYGTCEWIKGWQENFKKDKKKVFKGTILIIAGSVAQIVGLYI